MLKFETELFKEGLHTRLRVEQLDQNPNLVQVVFSRKLTTEQGEVVIDNNYQMFFEKREFADFFGPLVKTLNERFEYDPEFNQR